MNQYLPGSRIISCCMYRRNMTSSWKKQAITRRIRIHNFLYTIVLMKIVKIPANLEKSKFAGI